MLEPGELLGHLLSGGGGYGDPREREPGAGARGRARAVRQLRARTGRLRRRLRARGPRRLADGRRGGDAPAGGARDEPIPGLRGWTARSPSSPARARASASRCAEAMSEAGAKVVLVGPRPTSGCARCADRCGEHHVVAVDLTDDDAPRRIVAEALDAFGAITSLLHMAGIFWPEPARGGSARGLRRAVARERPGALRAHARRRCRTSAATASVTSSRRSPARSRSRTRPRTARRRERSS